MSLRGSLKYSILDAARFFGLTTAARGMLARRILILCYHGVVPSGHPVGPAQANTVTVEEFDRQIELLRRLFTPISATDLLHVMEGRTRPKPRSVLVTFDDGYRNNLTRAAPILQRHGVPALVSLSTDYIGRSRMLWTSEVALRLMSWPDAVPRPLIPEGGSPNGAPRPKLRRPKAEDIRTQCKRIPDEDRRAYLERLRQVPCPKVEEFDGETYGFLDWDEVRRLQSCGFEIASHTVTHPILSRLQPAQLDFELTESKARIEREVEAECPWIVYPNGEKDDITPEVTEAVARTGYKLGFTLTGSFVSPADHALALSRIAVPGHERLSVFESRISGLYSLIRR